MIENFKKDVDKGLSGSPKKLSSKYFYDTIGDQLFMKIMRSDDYYLTRAEFEIFQTKSQQIIDALALKPDTYFELIELGAGDGSKTVELLKVLHNKAYKFKYSPIDISNDVLIHLEKNLKKAIPELNISTKTGDYFEILQTIKSTPHPKVVLFLGSNLGNLSDNLAASFIYQIGAYLNAGDHLLLGLDLIKAKEIVLPAYNDSKGYTSLFNLNLLNRINVELGGHFNIDKFSHQPEYSEEEGVAKSFIVSDVKQDVAIDSLEKIFHFEEGEKIHTEISRKYNDDILNQIFDKTDFVKVVRLLDSNSYFADYIYVKKQ